MQASDGSFPPSLPGRAVGGFIPPKKQTLPSGFATRSESFVMRSDVILSNSMSRSFSIVPLLVVLSTSCTTERTVTTRSTSYSIKDGSEEGSINQKTAGNFMVDDDGNYVPAKRTKSGKLVPDEKKMNLYSDSRGERGKVFKSREARLRKDEYDTRQAKLPEFIERQQAKENQKSSRDSNLASGESDFANNRDAEANQTSAAEGEVSFFERLNPFRSNSTSSGDNALDKKTDRAGTRARENSVQAVPSRSVSGVELGESDQADQRSIDDVKRLLNPSRY